MGKLLLMNVLHNLLSGGTADDHSRCCNEQMLGPLMYKKRSMGSLRNHKLLKWGPKVNFDNTTPILEMRKWRVKEVDYLNYKNNSVEEQKTNRTESLSWGAKPAPFPGQIVFKRKTRGHMSTFWIG